MRLPLACGGARRSPVPASVALCRQRRLADAARAGGAVVTGAALARRDSERGIHVDEITGKTPDELAAIIGDYHGLAIRSSTKATAKLLDHATNLKVIGRAGIGVDNVEIPAATAKGIIVMNTPFGNSITTAEHAISLMMAVARQIPEAEMLRDSATNGEPLGRPPESMGTAFIGTVIFLRGEIRHSGNNPASLTRSTIFS